MSYDYDLFVIGAGSGGIAAARRAASYGAKVAIAEADDLGGTCVNRGCVPKKLMVYASKFSHQFKTAAEYGWTPVESRFNWSEFIADKDREIKRLNNVYGKGLEKAGVMLFRNRATLLDAHTLEVASRQITAEKIAIAVGAKPQKPDIPGIECAITSNEMFHLPQQPQSIIIIGGGYIGTEFSCIMNGLGSQVTLIIRRDLILNGFDEEIRSGVQVGMQQRGIEIIRNVEAEKIERVSRGLKVTLPSQSITVDAVLAATGRTPLLRNLGLEKAGVEIEKGAIAVDSQSRTSQPNIFALGDCTNRRNLTPVAIAEGRAFADTEFGNNSRQVSYEFIPSAVFSQPEAATVGMTEAEATEKFGDDIQCYRSQFKPLYYTLTEQDEKATLKLVVNSKTERVLGAHMVGEHAAEIIQMLAIALNMGATKKDLDATIGIHPSNAEEFVTMR